MTCNNKGGCCDADNAAVLQALYGLKEMVTEWDDEGESWLSMTEDTHPGTPARTQTRSPQPKQRHGRPMQIPSLRR